MCIGTRSIPDDTDFALVALGDIVDDVVQAIGDQVADVLQKARHCIAADHGLWVGKVLIDDVVCNVLHGSGDVLGVDCFVEAAHNVLWWCWCAAC